MRRRQGRPVQIRDRTVNRPYDGKRPDVKLHAAHIGIDTSFEFAPNQASSNGHRLRGIQTLLYPADLERQLRKIASEAKTAIEETLTAGCSHTCSAKADCRLFRGVYTAATQNARWQMRQNSSATRGPFDGPNARQNKASLRYKAFST